MVEIVRYFQDIILPGPGIMTELLSTRQVAKFLDINEKMVYTLISEKGLPASKVTGKWLFPRHLVEQWIEANTINYPETAAMPDNWRDLLVIAGSNDILLEKTICLFNADCGGKLAVFGNLGSMGGIRALKRNICHVATSHLLQSDEQDYNFEFAGKELDKMPVVVNFCRRRQGILLAGGNPHGLKSVADLGRKNIRIVNRRVGTGTRLVFDRELGRAGLEAGRLEGYAHQVASHMEVGLEILAGRADAGPGIEPVAGLLGLDFIPLRWERYDLLIPKQRFFDRTIQFFLGLLHGDKFKKMAAGLSGYDLRSCGQVVFPDLEKEDRKPTK